MSNHPDELIDQVLNALRDTEAPADLKARIATRLAQAEARTQSAFAPSFSAVITDARVGTTSFFAVILNAVKDPRILSVQANRYTLAITSAVLITISLIAFTSHHKPTTLAHWNPLPASGKPQTSTQLISPPQATMANTQIPQGFSLRSHSAPKIAEVSTPAPQQPDPDTIALAETLALSHPAPPMPLTQQELLLLKATRKGAPIELAELDLANAPAFRAAAETRREADIKRFAQNLFAPLAISESLQSTTQDADQSPPPPAPPSSPSN